MYVIKYPIRSLTSRLSAETVPLPIDLHTLAQKSPFVEKSLTAIDSVNAYHLTALVLYNYPLSDMSEYFDNDVVDRIEVMARPLEVPYKL